VDNLVGFFRELGRMNAYPKTISRRRLDFYFDAFLQVEKKVGTAEYLKEIRRYNECCAAFEKEGDKQFFAEVVNRFPEFEELFKKKLGEKPERRLDLMEFLMEYSEFLNREGNRWMKQILQVVRNTALFFQPQIRTKIMNEGWASYWHETLFLNDDRIKGHEVDFARVHAGVTSMPRVGLNPYAIGMRLFHYTEDLVNKGKYSFGFQKRADIRERADFNTGDGGGRDFIFDLRKNFNDFMFVNTFIDQDFVNDHRLFVADRRLNPSKMVWEYFVKSRRAEDYRDMILEKLYHPPHIVANKDGGEDKVLYLDHKFEGKPLVTDYIAGTLLGIEYLWGAPVKLETSEIVPSPSSGGSPGHPAWSPHGKGEAEEEEVIWQRVVYTMKDRKLTKVVKN
jgi:stage V sporulation protein R